MRPPIPQSVFDAFVAGKGRYRIESIPAGMSGAKVFRCTVTDHFAFALKRWPAGTSTARVAKIHRVVRSAREASLRFVPRLVEIGRGQPGWAAGHQSSARPASLVVCGDGYCWDATEWMSGQPLDNDAPALAIGRGAAAIAAFHRAVRSIETKVATPPAVEARLRRLEKLRPLISRLPPSIDRLPPSLFVGQEATIFNRGQSATLGELLAFLQRACSLLRLKWNEVEPRITRSLLQYAPLPMPNQWVLRDVHRENVLFVDQQPSGLIDFDAVRLDVPATDLARWTGSFLAGRDDVEAVWHAAVTGFDSQSQEFDRGFAESLVMASSWIGLANWLVWIVIEQRRFDAGPVAITRRLKELLEITASA